jgi:hypothetical protein
MLGEAYTLPVEAGTGHGLKVPDRWACSNQKQHGNWLLARSQQSSLGMQPGRVLLGLHAV